MKGRGVWVGFAALAFGVVAIAWSALLVRWAGMPGIASAFWRVLIASLVLWPAVGVTQRGALRSMTLRSMTRRDVGLALLGGVWFGADLGCYNVAVLRTSAGTATLLGNNAALVVGLLTWLSTRKAPAAAFWLAFAIATVGSWMVVGVDVRHSSTMAGADVLAVAASVFFALYLLVTERLRERCEAVTVLALSGLGSCAALLLCAVLTHTALAVPGPRSWAALLGLGLVCQVGGYFALTYALGHVRATVSSIAMLAVAPVTACLAWIFFRDRLSGEQVVGGLLVLAGVAAGGKERTPDRGAAESTRVSAAS